MLDEMTEFVIAHRASHHWTSITFAPENGNAQVYSDGHVFVMSRESAELTLQYCRQSGDYIVEEIRGVYRGAN